MATQVQIRRGTSSQVAAFTGAEGEIVVNTTNDSVHVNDGSTAGGFELARADLNNVSDADLNAALTGNTVSALTVTSLTSSGIDVTGTVTADGLTVDDTSGTVGLFNSTAVASTLAINNTHANAWGSNIAFRTGGTDAGYFGSIGSLLGNTDQDLTAYSTAGNGFRIYTNGNNERLRVTSAGNVGIGETSPSTYGKFVVTGSTPFAVVRSSDVTTAGFSMLVNSGSNGVGSIATDNGGHMTFDTGSTGAGQTERMRIDASGNLLVGQTSAVGVGGTPADVNGTEIGKGYINLNRDDTASANQIQFGKNGSVAGRITTTNTTSYVETSDRRVKSNIADAEDCGTAIDLMQVRKFDWKADGSHQDYGMIAQELLKIAPIAVDAPEDPSEMMGIDYSKLVPMLIKEIQSLRARVQQLENN